MCVSEYSTPQEKSVYTDARILQRWRHDIITILLNIKVKRHSFFRDEDAYGKGIK